LNDPAGRRLGITECLSHFKVDTYNSFTFLSDTTFSKPASTGTKKIGRFRGVAGFVSLLLQRIVKQGLKKLAGIQGGPVFRFREVPLY
jgi:hypothetical protein